MSDKDILCSVRDRSAHGKWTIHSDGTFFHSGWSKESDGTPKYSRWELREERGEWRFYYQRNPDLKWVCDALITSLGKEAIEEDRCIIEAIQLAYAMREMVGDES